MTSALANSARSRAIGYALVAMAAISWGTWPLILRHAPMPASLQSAVLMTVITLASLPLMLRDRLDVRPTVAEWAGIAALGVSDALNTVLFFSAVQRTTVAIAVLTHYLAPILVAFAAPLVLREKVRARTFAAIGIAFSGLVLLLEPWRLGLGRSDLLGAALGAGSAFFYAANVLVNKRLSRAFSGSEMMFFHGLFAAPLLVALVAPRAYAGVSAHALTTVVFGALGPGTLGGLLFVWGIRRIAASRASVLTLLEPFVAVALAVAFMGERLRIASFFGGALILGGAVLVITGGVQPQCTTTDNNEPDGVS